MSLAFVIFMLKILQTLRWKEIKAVRMLLVR